MVGLGELHGLWRRSMLASPDGQTDTTTDVFWVQGPSRYADLRIPQGRPGLRREGCLRDLNWPVLQFMARQEGFIGKLDIVDSVGHWHRAFDYRPETGLADKGRLEFAGDILVEHGVNTPYVEHWRREPGTDEAVVSIWLAAESSPAIGCLIAGGATFIYARSRTRPLPRNTQLIRLVEGASSLEEAQTVFDCEISFGRVIGNSWKIERSSLPFREERMLAPELDPNRELLGVDDVSPEGRAFKRVWRITECESAGASVFDLMQFPRFAQAAPNYVGLR